MVEIMERIDNKNANWLDQNLIRRNASTIILGNGIPQVFESYAKVFHPFEITVNEPEELKSNESYERDGTLNIYRNEEGNLKLYDETPDGQFIDVYKRKEQERAAWLAKPRRNATWKEVSEKYGIRYHNETNLKAFVNKFQEIGWPTNLGFPSEGFLPRKEFLRLLEVLKRHSTSDKVFIYQKAPHTIWKDDLAEDLVLASFEEAGQYFEEDFRGYLYDENKKWLIYTDTDLSFTLVGGDHSLIHSLSGSDLEVLRCTATTRIDGIKASE